jgi:non-ribosomal peptide synthetase component F
VLVKHLNGNLTIFMEWWSCHMSMEQAKNVASTFDRIVSIILLHPQTTVGKLDFFSERNKLQVLKWNSTPLEKVERCVHEVIQDQALRRPDFEAVCSWDGSFTYKQLDEIASRLAGHLMELGVGPEIRVPLCFEKSVSIALASWSGIL